ncbi:efflux transporter outer membrane subunit [Zavarzinia sp. CC-PAN008]|uniref:efflux transporter outer membrane subunit n=1 Tax=Zavarzinia sp. CC-PAN008 TaxID=3243332 RepID=UPI003F74A1F2
MPPARLFPLLVLVLALPGCIVGPDYERPAAPHADQFKAVQGWEAAVPGDMLAKGDWWTLFGDPDLDALVVRVAISNQNVAAAAASYAQARAIVRQQRSSLFPVVDIGAGGSRSGGGSATSERSSYQASIGASWEPDLWGRLSRGVEGSLASAQASAADLEAARLSARGEVAINYFTLRETDAEIGLLDQTIEAYEESLRITRNRYEAGIAPRVDVLQAETQLATTRSGRAGLIQQRQVAENAIAVLLGTAPSTFRIARRDWTPVVPPVPVGVPSTLLLRRPDIAAAERRVAAANAGIGVAESAFYPSLVLSGDAGSAASSLADLFTASASVWSLGLSAATTLIDFGAREAQVEQARAGYYLTVAQYRQTVLTALQDVENQLVAARALARQEELLRQASTAADEVERMQMNQYRAGLIPYTDVVQAQASALSARRSLIQASVSRQNTAVALIQALGGGWDAGALDALEPAMAEPAS